jgi:hypothetical protein
MAVAAAVRERGARLVKEKVRMIPHAACASLIWPYHRHQEVLRNDGGLLLPPDDPLSQRVSRVTSRLITALEEQDSHIVHGAAWPPKSPGDVLSEREKADRRGDVQYAPSGRTKSTFMPWRPVSSNPLKILESADWNVYVIDLVSRNG